MGHDVGGQKQREQSEAELQCRAPRVGHFPDAIREVKRCCRHHRRLVTESRGVDRCDVGDRFVIVDCRGYQTMIALAENNNEQKSL